MPIDAALITRLEDSFRRISARGDEFTKTFYRRLFEIRPELRSLFPEDMAAQRKKLLENLRMVIEHLRTPDRVRERLEELGRAHVRYGAKPEHYPVVTEMLVRAMSEELGGAWTNDLNEDWSDAIRLVSEIMQQGASADTPPPAQSEGEKA